MNWTIVTATNNEEILRTCLLSSPEIEATRVIQQKGYSSAAAAYNAGVAQAETDVVVLTHQDVYFPSGWSEKFQKALEALYRTDPNWAVAGSWGVHHSGARAGHIYCAGLGRTLGGHSEMPREVRTLDEVFLVLRKSSQVRFDESLPGYHFYGSDLCLEAERRGMKCYAIAAFCIHNTNGYGMLPWQFWKSYLMMRRKWKKVLPIITPCTEITQGCWPMIQWNLGQAKNIILNKHHPGKRVPNPMQLYQRLQSDLQG